MEFASTIAEKKTACFISTKFGRVASELAECGPIKFTTE